MIFRFDHFGSSARMDVGDLDSFAWWCDGTPIISGPDHDRCMATPFASGNFPSENGHRLSARALGAIPTRYASTLLLFFGVTIGLPHERQIECRLIT
jgi:hypothetical protein